MLKCVTIKKSGRIFFQPDLLFSIPGIYEKVSGFYYSSPVRTVFPDVSFLNTSG